MDIQQRKERIQFIINGLENNEAFKMFQEDMKESIRVSDDSWQYIDMSQDGARDRFVELKYNKLAAMSVIDCISRYRQELEMLNEREQVQSYYEDEDGS